MSSQLLNALQGCLDHRTVHVSEQKLKQMSYHPDFTEQLLRLIPNQENNLLIMVLTTLKNYLMERYNSNENRVSNGQKDILKGSMFDLYYAINHDSRAVELYKAIIYIVVAVDYPWQGIDQALMEQLNSRIEAGIYFSGQVVHNYQYMNNENRVPLEHFILHFYPKIEQIVEQILSNFNLTTSQLLEQILEFFYQSFHISIPEYLRDFAKLQRWMMFFNLIFSTPSNELSLKNQAVVARIYSRLFLIYCGDSADGKQYKGWAAQFRHRYAPKLYEQVYALIAARVGNEEILSNLVNCLINVIRNEELRPLINSEHIQNLFYRGVLFPLCESSKEELRLFVSQEIEYVRREDDLTTNSLRRSTLDLVEIAVNYLVFGQKQQLMRMVQYCAEILTKSNNDGQKEVAIRILSIIGKPLLRNSFFKKQFESLVVQYFEPVLSSENKLLNALICKLLAQYLPFGELSSQTVTSLMEKIYGKIIGENSLVVKYNAILAFTTLLSHKAALDSARPHFQTILQIYVKTLNAFDHESLIQCLSTIVKHFDNQIVSFAPDLIQHLLRMFCSLAKAQQEGDSEDDDKADSNTPAAASLNTVQEILNCKLSPEVYLNVSRDLIDLLRGILDQYNSYFDPVLSLFAVLCHQAKVIADFEYPYALCRRLLEGNSFNLSKSNLPRDILEQLNTLDACDSQFQQSLVAILKNIIQKGPEQVLRSYPWPTHPQLILALIENQRLSPQQLGNLNTSQVNEAWSPYLSAYSSLIYGVGSLADPSSIKGIVGLSLYPWLKQGVTRELVKLIIDSVDNEEEDEDLIQENTAQLLQRYANQNQLDDEQDFFEGSGVNYGYLYDPPFDPSKDRETLASFVKGLSQGDAVTLVNSLNSKDKRKLELLMTGNNQ